MTDVTKEYIQNGPSRAFVGDMNLSAKCLKDSPGMNKFSCQNKIMVPIDTNILAPFVIIKIVGVDMEISVGNNSTKGSNMTPGTAAVLNFSYGTTNGCYGEFEIVDEQGGSFTNFFERGLAKCISKMADAYKVEVNIGWVGVDCFNKGFTFPSISGPSSKIYLSLLSIDVTYSQGKIKYKIKCTDMMQATFATKYKKSFKGSLKKCIIDMLAEEPKIDVAFLRRKSNGGPPEPWNFINDGVPAAEQQTGDEVVTSSKGEGPVCVWKCNNETKLECLRRWINTTVTDNKKGIVPIWDPLNKIPTIILWEDVKPGCNTKSIDCNRSIGTFIVNGGKCSNVISFNPTMKWLPAFYALNAGGATGTTTSTETVNYNNEANDGGKSCGPLQTSYTGSTTGVPATDNDKYQYGKETGKKLAESQKANAKSSAIHEQILPIEATLVIVGNPDPVFLDIKSLIGEYVSVIVINPFSILPGGGVCGDWSAGKGWSGGSSLDQPGNLTASSSINTILSNRAWFINGVGQNIKDGKFTTELKLFLLSPGFDLAQDANLGNDPNASKAKICDEKLKKAKG